MKTIIPQEISTKHVATTVKQGLHPSSASAKCLMSKRFIIFQPAFPFYIPEIIKYLYFYLQTPLRASRISK